MIEIKSKEECCGCFGCYNICPKKCIEMKNDEEGFKYPKIDKNNCINCGLCEKVCPVIQKNNEKKDIKVYACKNKELETRLTSSSGGVFFAIVEYVIKNNGVVFGAKFNQSFEVEHGYGETLEECKAFKGSKYVQSSIKNNYKIAKKFLDEGKLVLFSGTPCQIEGLRAFLRKDYLKLMLIDLACHGCPSPLVFKKYKNGLEKKFHGKINKLSFRDKKDSWKSYKIKVDFDNGKEKIEYGYDNLFMKGFLKDLYLRPSCYRCEFKKPYTNADITLADYWGIQNIHPEIDDDKGTSLILINTNKGKEIFSKISKNLEIIESDFDFAVKNNPCIVRSVHYNRSREKFFEELNDNNLELLVNKYTKISIMKKIKIKLFSILVCFKKLIK